MAPALTQHHADLRSYIQTLPYTPSLRDIHLQHLPIGCDHNNMEHLPSGDTTIHKSKITAITAPNSKNIRSNGGDFMHSPPQHIEEYHKCVDGISSGTLGLSQPTPPHSTDSSAPLSPLPGDKCKLFSRVNDDPTVYAILNGKIKDAQVATEAHANINSSCQSPKDELPENLNSVKSVLRSEDSSLDATGSSNVYIKSPVQIMGYCPATATTVLANCFSAPQPNDTPPPSNDKHVMDIPNEKVQEHSYKLSPPSSNTSSERAIDVNSSIPEGKPEGDLPTSLQTISTLPVKHTSVSLMAGPDLSGDFLRLPDDVYTSLNTLLSRDIDLLLDGSCASSVVSEPIAELQPNGSGVISEPADQCNLLFNSGVNGTRMGVSNPALGQPVDVKDDIANQILSYTAKQLNLQKRRNRMLRRARRIGMSVNFSDISSQTKALSDFVGKLGDSLKPAECVGDDSSMSDLLLYVRSQEKLQDSSLSHHEPAANSNASRPLTGIYKEVGKFSGEMRAMTRLHTVHDSDATDSSSAVDSCDEMEGYDDSKKKQFKPLPQRALPSLQRERGWSSSRWSWLESRIHTLDSNAVKLNKKLRLMEQTNQPESATSSVSIDVSSPAHMSRASYTCVTRGDMCARTQPYRRRRKRRAVRVGRQDLYRRTVKSVQDHPLNGDGLHSSSACTNIDYSYNKDYFRQLGNTTLFQQRKHASALKCSCVAPFKCISCTSSTKDALSNETKSEILRTPEKSLLLNTPDRGSPVKIVNLSSMSSPSVGGSPSKRQRILSNTFNSPRPCDGDATSSYDGTFRTSHRSGAGNLPLEELLANQDRSFHAVLSRSSEIGTSARLSDILTNSSWFDRLNSLCCDDNKSEVAESLNVSTCSSTSHTRAKKKKKDRKRKRRKDKTFKVETSLKKSFRKCSATGEMEVFDLNAGRSAVDSADDTSVTGWENSSNYSSRASTPAFEQRPNRDRRPSRSRYSTHSNYEMSLAIGATAPVKTELTECKEIDTPSFYNTAATLAVCSNAGEDVCITLARHRTALLEEQERFDVPQRSRARRPNSTASDQPLSPHDFDYASPMMSPNHNQHSMVDESQNKFSGKDLGCHVNTFEGLKDAAPSKANSGPFTPRTFPLNDEDWEQICADEEARKYQQLFAQEASDVFEEHPDIEDDADYIIPSDPDSSKDWSYASAGYSKRKNMNDLEGARAGKKSRTAEELRQKNGNRLTLPVQSNSYDASFSLKERRNSRVLDGSEGACSPQTSDTDSAGEDGTTGELPEHMSAAPCLTLTATADSMGRCCVRYVRN